MQRTFFRDILEDIRTRKNLDVYGATLINIILIVLGFLKVISFEILAAAILASLSWLTLNILSGRKDNQRQLSDFLNEIRTQIQQSSEIATKSLEIGLINIWTERRQIHPNFWNEFTKDARHEVWLYGFAESGFASDDRFHQIVADGVARGCNYKILILSTGSPYVKLWDDKDEPKGIPSILQSATKHFKQIIEQNKGKPGIVELRVYDSVPTISVVRSDDEMMVTLYISHRRGNMSPTLHIRNAPNGFFKNYEIQFEREWKEARPLMINNL